MCSLLPDSLQLHRKNNRIRELTVSNNSNTWVRGSSQMTSSFFFWGGGESCQIMADDDIGGRG